MDPKPRGVRSSSHLPENSYTLSPCVGWAHVIETRVVPSFVEELTLVGEQKYKNGDFDAGGEKWTEK